MKTVLGYIGKTDNDTFTITKSKEQGFYNVESGDFKAVTDIDRLIDFVNSFPNYRYIFNDEIRLQILSDVDKYNENQHAKKNKYAKKHKIRLTKATEKILSVTPSQQGQENKIVQYVQFDTKNFTPVQDVYKFYATQILAAKDLGYEGNFVGTAYEVMAGKKLLKSNERYFREEGERVTAWIKQNNLQDKAEKILSNI